MVPQEFLGVLLSEEEGTVAGLAKRWYPLHVVLSFNHISDSLLKKSQHIIEHINTS